MQCLTFNSACQTISSACQTISSACQIINNTCHIINASVEDVRAGVEQHYMLLCSEQNLNLTSVDPLDWRMGQGHMKDGLKC